MKFKNPTILASGILDETGHSMLRVMKAGAGGVVTKSIGTEPRNGHPNPTVFELNDGCGLLNAMGLPNPGIEGYAEELRLVSTGGNPIILSIFSDSPDGFAELAKEGERLGVDAVELNVSCPHAKGYGAQLGQDPVVVKAVTSEVKRAVRIPVWVKLTPNVADIVPIAEAARNGGADAIVAINTLKAIAIDVDVAMPVLGNKVGGLSGPAVKPVGIRAIYDIHKKLGSSTDLIGVGGISSGRDALEYIMAGASAVEIGSAVLADGPDVFGRIVNELNSEMDRLGYSKIKDVVGLATRR